MNMDFLYCVLSAIQCPVQVEWKVGETPVMREEKAVLFILLTVRTESGEMYIKSFSSPNLLPQPFLDRLRAASKFSLHAFFPYLIFFWWPSRDWGNFQPFDFKKKKKKKKWLKLSEWVREQEKGRVRMRERERESKSRLEECLKRGWKRKWAIINLIPTHVDRCYSCLTPDQWSVRKVKVTTDSLLCWQAEKRRNAGRTVIRERTDKLWLGFGILVTRSDEKKRRIVLKTTFISFLSFTLSFRIPRQDFHAVFSIIIFVS